MTPEREAEIRGDHDGLCDDECAVVELLAEIDRLRALPVLRTCGECGHASPRSRRSHLCDHPDVYDVPDPHLLKIDHDAAPPERCPLRSK